MSLKPMDGEDVAKLKLAIQACKEVSEREKSEIPVSAVWSNEMGGGNGAGGRKSEETELQLAR